MTTATRTHHEVGAYDAAIQQFSRQRHLNTLFLDALAERWSVAASDMRAIYFLNYRDAPTPKQVGEFLGITTGAMTSLIDRIERAGLARRAAHPSDRRSIVVELTDRGRDAVADAVGFYERAFASVVTPEETAMLTGIFERMAAAFEAGRLEASLPRD